MWWRDFFSDLSAMDMIDKSLPIIQDCLRYCFIHLIRNDLDEFTKRLNTHLIAESKGAIVPNGRPNCLYHLPHLYHTESFSKQVDFDTLEQFDHLNAEMRDDTSEEFDELADLILTQNHMSTDKRDTPAKALDLYVFLLQKIEEFS